MSKKYPPKTNNPTTTENTQTPLPEKIAHPKTEPTPSDTIAFKPKEELFEFEGENLKFQVSSRGMGLTGIVLKNYFDRELKQISFQSNTPLFATHQIDEPIFFKVKKTENEFVGTFARENFKITKTLTVYDE